MYTHDGPNLYLTSDDQVVEEGDPRAATLLVATGCDIPDEVAKRYGLKAKPAKGEPREMPEEGDLPAKAKDAPQNKAKAPTQQNKAG